MSGFKYRKGEKPSQPNETSSKLPDGAYRVIISTTDFKPTKSGKGYALEVRFQVIEGPHKGSTIRQYFNCVNESEKSEKIAAAQLEAMWQAIGMDPPEEHEEMRNKTLSIVVGPQKDKPQYSEVKEFHPFDSDASEDNSEGDPDSPEGEEDGDVPDWMKKKAS